MADHQNLPAKPEKYIFDEQSSSRIDKLCSRIVTRIFEVRRNIARSIDIEIVKTYWLTGQDIVEEELNGKKRAEYGEHLLEHVSARLTKELGKGYNISNLRAMKRFYETYPSLVPIQRAARTELIEQDTILNPNLSWTHYRLLIRINRKEARDFYEKEASKNRWSSRELKRQINSLLFDRLAKSRDKNGLLRLAKEGQEIHSPEDIIKDPLVLEFLNIPESHKLVESTLENALISNLQDFLLELGKGFAFVARQRRLTLNGDHFYVDLVMYHTILKCYVLLELKSKEITHADLGQIQFYVNYFDEMCRYEGDNPTVGIILCTEKNDAMVKYTLGDKAKQIFASKYQFHLPTEAELEAEIKREIKEIQYRLKFEKNKNPENFNN